MESLQKIERELQLAAQLLGADLLFRRCEQHIGQQADRCDRGRRIDAAHDLLAERIDDVVEPGRPVTVAVHMLPPVRLHAVQHRFQFDGLAYIDVHATEVLAQRLHGAYEPEHGFLFLLGAAQLTDERITLDELFVTEVDRHEDNRPLRVLHKRIDGHGEHAAFRLQQPPRAAAAALDEVFDRIAACEQLVQVSVEYRRVQAVAAEAPPQEKRAAAPQDAADDGQVQIDTGRDVRQLQALLVTNVAQEKVIEVTAVTGRIHDDLFFREIAQLLDMIQFDAIVNLVP